MSDDVKEKLGKLTTFGIHELWQVPLFLPRDWEDFTKPTQGIRQVSTGENASLLVTIESHPVIRRNKRPHSVTFTAKDAQGTVFECLQFGNTSNAQDNFFKDARVLLRGKKTEFRSKPQLGIAEVIPQIWQDKLRPTYPGKPSVISSELAQKRIISLLPSTIPLAANKLRELISDFTTEEYILKQSGAASVFKDFEKVLWASHLPLSKIHGEVSHMVLEFVSSAVALWEAKQEVGKFQMRNSLAMSRESIADRMGALPYPLTDEQSKAVDEIVEDFRRPVAMRRLLSGDVGTGKTAVYGTAAAAAYDAGARIAMMLPNINLATQVFNEISEYWPDMEAVLVSASLSRKTDLKTPRVLVGTSALIKRDIGERDLVIIDEQHKFSRSQREILTKGSGHLLEVSATCIPRSQALLKFGVMSLSTLKKGHVEKEIHTKIQFNEDRKGLMRAAIQTVEDGHQLAVVYPLKENAIPDDGEISESDQRQSATLQYDRWNEIFPGRVRLLHGQMTDEEKQSVINDMKQDKADVLISTTVIEVGLTLPRLRRLMVISADRHGLTGLHQLRGRLARHGGVGHFDLFIPSSRNTVNPSIVERLSILEKTTDGFLVAEHDMKQRGYGNLGGEKQSGKTLGVLVNRPIDPDRIAFSVKTIPALSTDIKPAAAAFIEDQSDDLGINETLHSMIKRDVGFVFRTNLFNLTLYPGDCIITPAGVRSEPFPVLKANQASSHASMAMSWLNKLCIKEAGKRVDWVNLAAFKSSQSEPSDAALASMAQYVLNGQSAKQLQEAIYARSSLASVGANAPMKPRDMSDVQLVRSVKWFGSEEKAHDWISKQDHPSAWVAVRQGSRVDIYPNKAQQPEDQLALSPSPKHSPSLSR